MTAPLTDAQAVLRPARITLALAGIIALIVGIMVLVWPLKSAVFFTALIAAYLVIAGLVYLALAVFSKEKTGWARVGHGVLGVLYIVAGAAAFVNLVPATFTLFVFLAVLVGISWIIDAVVALAYIGDAGSKAWTILYSLLSLAGGVALLFSPAYGAEILWWILGITLVVLGVVQIVRAITLGRALKGYSVAG